MSMQKSKFEIDNFGAFAYWNEPESEIRFFKDVWNALDKESLMDYSNKFEKSKVVIRWLTIGFIYADFIHLLLYDDCEPWLMDDFDGQEIPTYYVALLLNDNNKDWCTDIEDEHDFLMQALEVLVENEKPIIHKVLTKHFQNDLFAHFCRAGSSKFNLESSIGDVWNKINIEIEPFSNAFMYVTQDQFLCERWY